MDKLKNFIDTNREAFEDDLLPEGHFERFEKKLSPARRKHFKLYSLSAFAAAAAIALILLLRMPGGTPAPVNQKLPYSNSAASKGVWRTSDVLQDADQRYHGTNGIVV